MSAAERLVKECERAVNGLDRVRQEILPRVLCPGKAPLEWGWSQAGALAVRDALDELERRGVLHRCGNLIMSHKSPRRNPAWHRHCNAEDAMTFAALRGTG